MTKINTAIATFAAAMLWASSAFAFCIGPICFGPPSGGGGGGPAVAPEIDGPASLTAIALLISVGAIVYRKMKR